MSRWFGVMFLAATLPLLAQEEEPESWIDSPEAYFATRTEREEWQKMTTRADREAFKERYWVRRDPTRGTEKNEFRETILGRIRTADNRWTIGRRSGSRTARGLAFILFGSPARVQEEHAGRLAPPCTPRPGVTCPPAGLHEGNEAIEVWIWDRERTPRILEALDRPSLELTVVIEPSRRRDRLQQPGLVNQYRELLAEKTIVNPDLVRGARPVAAAPSRFAPAGSVPEAVRRALANAEGRMGHAVLWHDGDRPFVVVWLTIAGGVTDPAGSTLWGEIQSGESVQWVAAPAVFSDLFFTVRGERVVAGQIDLPPGSHSGAFALAGRDGAILASGRTPLRVSPLGGELAVSSLVIAGGANPASAAGPQTFRFGNAMIAPRADATFLRSESLWYFFEIASVPAPENLALRMNLRRGTAPMGQTLLSPAQLQPSGDGRFVAGFEMPLSAFEPGDYALYLTVVDSARGSEAVRRADFQILPD